MYSTLTMIPKRSVTSSLCSSQVDEQNPRIGIYFWSKSPFDDRQSSDDLYLSCNYDILLITIL